MDPTLQEGFPLWGGYRNLEPCPGMQNTISSCRPRTSLFEDVIHYVMQMSEQDIRELPGEPRNFALAILGVIGAEWLTVIKYLTTRLTKIEH